jgi:hypothetical protein
MYFQVLRRTERAWVKKLLINGIINIQKYMVWVSSNVSLTSYVVKNENMMNGPVVTSLGESRRHVGGGRDVTELALSLSRIFSAAPELQIFDYSEYFAVENGTNNVKPCTFHTLADERDQNHKHRANTLRAVVRNILACAGSLLLHVIGSYSMLELL